MNKFYKNLILTFSIFIVILLSGFQNMDELPGIYIQQYSIGKFYSTRRLILKRDFQFTEKITIRNDLGKSNFVRDGSWSLKENMLILYNRKDEFNDCGHNANYYEIECPNDTFIVKDKGLWSFTTHHDVVDYKQEYARK